MLLTSKEQKQEGKKINFTCPGVLVHFFANLSAKQRLIINKPNFSCWRPYKTSKTQNSSLGIFAVGSFILTLFFPYLPTKQRYKSNKSNFRFRRKHIPTTQNPSLCIFPVGSFVPTLSYDILGILHNVNEMEWSKEKTREGAVIFWIGDFCNVVVVIALIPRWALADSHFYFNFSSWLDFPFMLKFIF